ncbi:MAG: carboxypeptidase regulatory-like domain-containing protein [Candidatus Cloacimonetes bacterium]|nr:carboxypeptidase regulatory-like domain-containing protein [Candidatus Cloacimonadota bacterium]
MKYPEIYIRAKNPIRLNVKSIGKLIEDLNGWVHVRNVKKGSKTSTEGETEEMGDGGKSCTAEKLVYEFSGIEMITGDFTALKTLLNDPVDVCFFDKESREYIALYRCRGSVKKTAESGNSITFDFIIEKRCTNSDHVSHEYTLDEAYVSGIVIDSEDNPVSNATVTCIDPEKPGYFVITDIRGEFKIEVKCNISGESKINISKDSTSREVIVNVNPGDSINDLVVRI